MIGFNPVGLNSIDLNTGGTHNYSVIQATVFPLSVLSAEGSLVVHVCNADIVPRSVVVENFLFLICTILS